MENHLKTYLKEVYHRNKKTTRGKLITHNDFFDIFLQLNKEELFTK